MWWMWIYGNQTPISWTPQTNASAWGPKTICMWSMSTSLLLEGRATNSYDLTSAGRQAQIVRVSCLRESVSIVRNITVNRSDDANGRFIYCSYDTPGGLSTHKKQIHCTKPKKETNVCHVCAKIFATRTGLQEHMSSIHQPREKDQMQCTECGKW